MQRKTHALKLARAFSRCGSSVCARVRPPSLSAPTGAIEENVSRQRRDDETSRKERLILVRLHQLPASILAPHHRPVVPIESMQLHVAIFFRAIASGISESRFQHGNSAHRGKRCGWNYALTCPSMVLTSSS